MAILCFDIGGTDIKYGPSQLYLYTCNDKYGKSIRIVGWNRV
jgi:hypothetical protein